MKKLITILLIMFSITISAQDKTEKRADMSHEEMGALQAKRITMQLDLNAEQEEKLKVLFTKRIEAHHKFMQERKEEKAEMRKERLEMNDAQKAELREILTQEQYLKWEQLQEKRRKGRRAPMREKN